MSSEPSQPEATDRFGVATPPCPGCGSPPAANGNLDDVCPRCGAYMFYCGIVELRPLAKKDNSFPAPVYQRRTGPFWQQLPPSQVRTPRLDPVAHWSSQTAPYDGAPPRKGKGKGKGINEKITRGLEKDADSYGWSAKKWADLLGCSVGTIFGCPAWKTIMTARALREAERMTRQGTYEPGDRRTLGRKPKAAR
jgi:hypothetical protein